VKVIVGIAAASVLTACGAGSASPPIAPTVQRATWMSPAAQKQPSLLYVSNAGTQTVTVYTYLDGAGLLLVGTLTGFTRPSGMCTDKAGDVWIADAGARTLFEYAHGGTTPIHKIREFYEEPYDCSVDPNTGDLAVANFRSSRDNITVYPAGRHRGVRYGAPARDSLNYLAYDDKSNIFVDGKLWAQDQAVLLELRAGTSQLFKVPVHGATLHTVGAVNWVKPTLLVGDDDFENGTTSGAYKLFVSGGSATVVGTLLFKGTRAASAFWRRASRVIVPDYALNAVRIYDLSDGTLYSQLTTDISSPAGTVVSQSP
jgi:hypothetical protein